MAFIITSSCRTPLAAATAARMWLQGAAGVTTARLLQLGSGIASVRVAAVLPVVVLPAVGGAASSARTTRCAAGGQASPTSEPLTAATFATLINELQYWLTNPPKCKEDFNMIEVTTGKCMGLFKRMIIIIIAFPGDIIHEGIATIANIDTTFVELHNQSRGENPWADADIIEAAIKGLNRLAQIFVEGSLSSARTRCTARDQASPTSEPLTMATFATLANELQYWLIAPPECKEDFKKIEITASKCVDLFPRMVHDFTLVPANILKEIADISESIFVKLHNQSTGEDPKAEADTIEAAIKGIERMAKIFLAGAPGLMGYTRP